MNKRLVFRVLGYLFCLVPPVLAILERFPLWAREGGAPVVSGLALLLLLVAAIPLRRGLLSLFRRFLASPSAFTVWGVLWLLCEWLGHIATAVADIALVATVSSFVGAVFFRLAARGESA
ncbi:MAG: hypothetical protein IKC73_02795 [Clostridia bacterium]|nr:hypothetical protein [Clostridia bacterium]